MSMPNATELSLGERWIAFLRSYGPVNKNDNMFAEMISSLAKALGVSPLAFEHPRRAALKALIDPSAGRLTNIVLTGTAGDGKTSLCHEMWTRFGGEDARVTGVRRDSYQALEVKTPEGPKTLHFIFEFSGWAPEQGQAWSPEKLDLLERFARAVLKQGTGEEYFILAANDGKLVEVFDAAPEGSLARSLQASIEDLLATEKEALPALDLAFINLSLMSTADLLDRALDCLLDRPEWGCFTDEQSDPAFGPDSSLTRNFLLLREPAMRERLRALGELLDANGLHVPIREILLLLANALLGLRGAPDGLAAVEDLRRAALAGRLEDGPLYGNLFGANLSARRRDQFAVFRNLGGFRIGQETTNSLDSLIIFGAEDPRLAEQHAQWLDSDPFYGANPGFKLLRDSYLEGDEERAENGTAFLEALVGERRRLFFRLPEQQTGQLDPWRLSVFHSAGLYRQKVLQRLKAGGQVEANIIRELVCGLNRIWTGMLVRDGDKLYLTTGLDLSSARISDVYLYEAPIQGSLHGDAVTITTEPGRPTLRVTLGGREDVDFPLTLVRFEFLTRVAQGALPGSFSKECNEDVLAFKSKVLSAYDVILNGRALPLSILSVDPSGVLTPRPLSLL
jgi:hypothetical protein